MFPGRYKADTAPIPELRPDSSGLVNDLFYRQDTRGHDYLEKSDLESALAKGATGESATTDIVFSSLDGDGDGRITKNELASALKKLAQELVEQFNAGRMARATGGTPPSPPPQQNDTGFSADELSPQLEDATASGDSQRVDLLNDIIANFDAADSDGDGRGTSAKP